MFEATMCYFSYYNSTIARFSAVSRKKKENFSVFTESAQTVIILTGLRQKSVFPGICRNPPLYFPAGMVYCYIVSTLTEAPQLISGADSTSK